MNQRNLSKNQKVEITPPNLNDNERLVLERFSQSGSTDAILVKKTLLYYVEDARDIMNIDPSGNMGLQALARQEACKIVEAMASTIFPDMPEFMNKPEARESINPWR